MTGDRNRTLLRVHAVSSNRPMLRTLEATLRGAELTMSPELAGVPSEMPPGATVLLDADTTAGGLRDVAALRDAGVQARVVVIGDTVPTIIPDEHTSLLVRPVPFAELNALLDPHTAPAPVPTPEPLVRDDPSPPPADGAAPRAEVQPPRRRTRRRVAQRATSDADLDLETRLGRAVPALEDLLHALREFPEIADPGITGQTLVEDLLGTLPRATTAAVLLRIDPARLQTVAGCGLTPAERLLRVPLGHPLITFLRGNDDGLVLARNEAAELLHGVPGVRAPTLIVHSLRTDDRWHGFVVVGAADLDRHDLGTATAVVQRGGPAVVASSYVRRLRTDGRPEVEIEDASSPRAG